MQKGVRAVAYVVLQLLRLTCQLKYIQRCLGVHMCVCVCAPPQTVLAYQNISSRRHSGHLLTFMCLCVCVLLLHLNLDLNLDVDLDLAKLLVIICLAFCYQLSNWLNCRQ